jgi:hypothetical protein
MRHAGLFMAQPGNLGVSASTAIWVVHPSSVDGVPIGW